MKRRGSFFWVIAAVIWLGAIFLFSIKTGAESNETSSSLATVLSSLLAPDFSSWAPSKQSEWLSGINSLLRKMAHFFEFGLLGFLVYRTLLFLSGKSRKKKPVNKFALGTISFSLCVVFAALDEVLQISTAGRTSSSSDVIVDCAGIFLGVIISAYKTKVTNHGSSSQPAVRRRRG